MARVGEVPVCCADGIFLQAMKNMQEQAVQCAISGAGFCLVPITEPVTFSP